MNLKLKVSWKPGIVRFLFLADVSTECVLILPYSVFILLDQIF